MALNTDSLLGAFNNDYKDQPVGKRIQRLLKNFLENPSTSWELVVKNVLLYALKRCRSTSVNECILLIHSLGSLDQPHIPLNTKISGNLNSGDLENDEAEFFNYAPGFEFITRSKDMTEIANHIGYMGDKVRFMREINDHLIEQEYSLPEDSDLEEKGRMNSSLTEHYPTFFGQRGQNEEEEEKNENSVSVLR